MLNKKEIEKLSSDISALVLSNHLKEALVKLSKLMEGMHVADFTLQYESLDQTYRMLLEYTFRGVPDPQRDRILQSLRVSILELMDLVQQKALSNTGMHIYALKSRIEKEKETATEEAARKIDSLHFEKELARLLHENDVIGEEIGEGLPHITPKLFQLIWLTDKYTEPEIQLIEAIRKSEDLPWYEKSLAVSAITLSLLNCFDKEKFNLLFNFYKDQEDQVWQRALVALVLAIYFYGKRVKLYPAVMNRLEEWRDDQDHYKRIQRILIQVYKAKETEKLTSRFREEILPDVQKFESKLREKLDIDNLLSNELIEDQNPDWEKIFEDSPDLLNKIEKLSEMQMEGLDLFMGTFAMLKNFDFFRELSNWFRPFYRENASVRQSMGTMDNLKSSFLSGMQESFYMCNSDKYSFCFNMSHLPEEQARNMMSMFNMEAENLREMNEENKMLHKDEMDVFIFTQYIQDLYRFFKLHPFRNDFPDIFQMDWDITKSELFEILKDQPETLKIAGQFLFQKEHYTNAIKLFHYLSELENPEQEVIEKLAYAYQLSGDYMNALKFYKQAELFESNRLWNIKKIVYCYRMLKDTASAISWGKQAIALAPDDVYLNTMLGNCYLDEKYYEKALDHYFRVEFLSPENLKVKRPIAWCCFALNKLEMARTYIEDIISDSPQPHDYINAGHIEFSLQNKVKAIEYYRKALSFDDISFAKFNEIIEFDSEFMISNGVLPEEIPMINDYLRY